MPDSGINPGPGVILMMRKISLRVICQVFLLSISAYTLAQSPDQQEAEARLAQSQDLVEAISSEFGRNSPRLIEPMAQLANSLTILNRFTEAHRTLEQAMQIARLEDGLYTEDQIPLIRQKIDNFSEGRDWSSAREQMDYLFWFYDSQKVTVDSRLIDDLISLSDQHLRGAAEDLESWQGYHLLQAKQLNWAIISTANTVYGKDHPRRVPLLYRQLQHLYLLKQAVEGRGRPAAELRRIVQGSGRLRESGEVVNSYFFVGLSLLDQIRNVYLSLPVPDIEGQAMAELYAADWHLLFDHPLRATDLYSTVYSALMRAGLAEQQVASYFSEPRIIPLQHFYPSVELAAAGAGSAEAESLSASAGKNLATLVFTEWSSGFSSVPRKQRALAEDSAGVFALLSFQLRGENEYSRWIKGKITQAISSAFDGAVVQGLGGNELGQQELLEKLGRIHFRPKLSGGMLQQSSAMLKYYPASNP